jgi:cytochrome c-type biogenesis protein CcmE
MKRPRVATLVGLVLVVGAFLALVTVGLTSALVYYVTPSELASKPAAGAVRLYGVVEPGSVQWNAGASTLTFRITDGKASIAVASRSLPTGLFRDGIGVVLAGRLTGPGAFAADEILVKHSEVYEPLQPGQTLPPGLLDMIRGDAP